MLFFDVTKTLLLRQPIACYEIATRTYDFVITYVGNRTINMTLVVLFLVGNKFAFVSIRSTKFHARVRQKIDVSLNNKI